MRPPSGGEKEKREEEERVEVEGMDKERRRKRMEKMTRGGLRWEDMAVRGGEV